MNNTQKIEKIWDVIKEVEELRCAGVLPSEIQRIKIDKFDEIAKIIQQKAAYKPKVPQKTTGTALLLTALGFFGLAGVQHFYLDNPTKGFIWLITCGVFGIGTIVDLFTIDGQVSRSNILAEERAEVLRTKYKKKRVKY